MSRRSTQGAAHNQELACEKNITDALCTKLNITDALCTKLRARTSGRLSDDGALWEGTDFWDGSGRARRTAITTFFFCYGSTSRRYSEWSKTLYENDIGTGISRRSVLFEQNDLNKVKKAGAPEALLLRATKAAEDEEYLACYTQLDDNGTLAEHLLESGTAYLAWQELFVLMHRYARLYLSCSTTAYLSRDTTAPLLLRKWDPSHVAVYHVRGGLQLRFLEPLVFAAVADHYDSLDLLVNTCNRLKARGKDHTTYLATALYLTLLLNGMTYFADSDQLRSAALQPLLPALTTNQFSDSWKDTLLGLLEHEDLYRITSRSGALHLNAMQKLLKEPDAGEQSLEDWWKIFWKQEGRDFVYGRVYGDLTIGEFLCLLELYRDRTDCMQLPEPTVRKGLLRFDSTKAIDEVFSSIKANAGFRARYLWSQPSTCTKFFCFIHKFYMVKRQAAKPTDPSPQAAKPTDPSPQAAKPTDPSRQQNKGAWALSPLEKEFKKLRQPYSLLPGGCLWAVRDFIYRGTQVKRRLTEDDANVLMYALHALVDARAGGSLSSYDVGTIRYRLTMPGLQYRAGFSQDLQPKPAGRFCKQCAKCKNANKAPRKLCYDADNSSEEDKKAWARVAPNLPVQIQETMLYDGFLNSQQTSSMESFFYSAMNNQGFQLSDPAEGNAPAEIRRGLYLCKLDVISTKQHEPSSVSGALVFFWHVSATGEMSQVTMGPASCSESGAKQNPAHRVGSWWSRKKTETFLITIQAAINACDCKDFSPAFQLATTYINSKSIPSDTTGWQASVKFRLRCLGADQLPSHTKSDLTSKSYEE